jgi:hypothetical protein
MNIEHFDDLLAAARAQPTPERLLLVFSRAELPDDASPEERLAFEQGMGGALAPVFCVDKDANELASCRIPDDCIDSKRYPLFIAREAMRALVYDLTQAQGEST